jgi:hypothetical protein
MRFNQDSASQEYGSAFGRAMGVDTYNRQNQFNMLSYLAGTGQNAAAMTGQAGVNTGAGMAGSILAGGQAQAAGHRSARRRDQQRDPRRARELHVPAALRPDDAAHAGVRCGE